MTEGRSRSVWPFVTAALIGLPVLYVLGFGPACWVISRIDRVGEKTLETVYWPLARVMLNSRSLLSRYLSEKHLLAPVRGGVV